MKPDEQPAALELPELEPDELIQIHGKRFKLHDEEREERIEKRHEWV